MLTCYCSTVMFTRLTPLAAWLTQLPSIRALTLRNLAAIGEAEVSSEYSCLGVHGFFETE